MQATLTNIPPHLHSAEAAALGHQVAMSSANSPESDISLRSELLLRGNKSVAIVHNGSIYRLQATKLGKLILTK